MKTAEQILKNKGYDLNEINDIINFRTKHSENGLDMKVRAEFGLDGEPLHLYEAYYIGDANELNLKAKAIELGYRDGCEDEENEGNISEMLSAMDRRLNDLCEDIPTRGVEFKYDNRDVVVVTGYESAKKAIEAAQEFLNEIEDEESEYAIANEHDEPNEDGSYDFRVKCYDKN